MRFVKRVGRHASLAHLRILTKNGRGRYVIQDISDYERYEAEKTLLAQLDYGKRVDGERGTLTTEQVRGVFSERFAPEA